MDTVCLKMSHDLCHNTYTWIWYVNLSYDDDSLVTQESVSNLVASLSLGPLC